ncbi:MAG TPA: GNAT family N-acetyltransferase, partial [Afipia sp.]|nr:GNAT family N-acetyltransferase [Afipia sp.]
GDHPAAKRLFKTLTAIRPEIYKPWFCLAQSCDALGHHIDAVNAYREVIRLKPDLPEAFANLAAILVKLGRIEDVNAALVTALGRTDSAPKLNGREPKVRRVTNGRMEQGEVATA